MKCHHGACRKEHREIINHPVQPQLLLLTLSTESYKLGVRVWLADHVDHFSCHQGRLLVVLIEVKITALPTWSTTHVIRTQAEAMLTQVAAILDQSTSIPTVLVRDNVFALGIFLENRKCSKVVLYGSPWPARFSGTTLDSFGTVNCEIIAHLYYLQIKVDLCLKHFRAARLGVGL